ncbi:hypothetical protein D9615_009132 [Tricholomella constricta]|uniref:Uncharacterized protein n=1 Tax=Tricholomella constricta TaxID=117010 RepID=A0A8H5H159_9AGAR|nr:hypothetical protein D9615_009132 [Tricholomella constricta]
MSTTIMLGIDFGDQLCKVAIANPTDNGRIDELNVSFLSPLLPSFLLVEDERSIRFGIDAQAANNQANIGSLKRLLAFVGGEFPENYDPLTPFVLKKKENGEVGVEVNIAGAKQVFPAIQLISLFLRRVIALASSLAQGEVTQTVVTVPSWFSNAQQKSMAEACELAGLGLVGIITETTAAQIDYAVSGLRTLAAETQHNVIFIDIGHTATSVSVLSLLNGKPVSKSVISDPSFGGRNIDLAILNHLRTLAPEFSGNSLSVLADIQKVKEALHLCALKDSLSVVSSESEVFLSGETLYKLVGSLNCISRLVKEALNEAGLTLDVIHRVRLSGGSMRLLQVRDCIASLFPLAVLESGSQMAGARGSLSAISGLFSGSLIWVKLENNTVMTYTMPQMRHHSPEQQYTLVLDEKDVLNELSFTTSEVTFKDALQSQNRLVEMTPDDHPDKSLHLNKLATLLSEQPER